MSMVAIRYLGGAEGRLATSCVIMSRHVAGVGMAYVRVMAGMQGQLTFDSASASFYHLRGFSFRSAVSAVRSGWCWPESLHFGGDCIILQENVPYRRRAIVNIEILRACSSSNQWRQLAQPPAEAEAKRYRESKQLKHRGK